MRLPLACGRQHSLCSHVLQAVSTAERAQLQEKMSALQAEQAMKRRAQSRFAQFR